MVSTGIRRIQKVEGLILIILFCITVIFGYIGYTSYFENNNLRSDPLTVIYEVMRLFIVEASFTEQIPLSLNIARFTAPLLFAYTGLKTILIIFGEKIKLIKLRYTEAHVVVCGAGEKGVELIKDFIEEDYKVVVIEINKSIEDLETIRDLGAIILIGNASDQSLLNTARVSHAKYVISTVNDDEVNIEVANQVKILTERSNNENKVKCIIHINDKTLYDSLYQIKSYNELIDNKKFDLDFFNIHNYTARILLLNYKLESLISYEQNNENQNETKLLKISIIGWNVSTESLILNIMRLMQFSDDLVIEISLIDISADEHVTMMYNNYPGIKDLIKIVPVKQFVKHKQSLHHQLIEKYINNSNIIFINHVNEMTSFTLTLELLNYYAMKSFTIPIFVHLKNVKGVVNFFQNNSLGKMLKKKSSIYTYGLMSEVCSKEVVVHEILDLVAKKLHLRYLTEAQTKGFGKSSATVPWQELPNHYKNANRYLADHIPIKLRSLNLTVRHVINKETIKLYKFSKIDLEELSRAEHKRWSASKILEGWKYSENRDDSNKKHPSLIPWEQLSEEEKEKDRVMIREIPIILKEINIEIVNKSTT